MQNLVRENNMKAVAFFFSCLFILSCTSPHYSPEMEEVLSQAGINRQQLENVLEYYSQKAEDSLKLRAAEFLIVNMPGKCTEKYNASWENIAAALYRWNEIPDKTELSRIYSWGESTTQEDVRHITAQYLINNIELAFKVWQEQPWGEHISFDVFCEEILPYRVGKEPLENWREKVLESFEDLNIYFKKRPEITAVEACRLVNKQLPRFAWVNYPMPAMNYSMLMTTPRGTCDEMGALAIFVMRALGIPVVRDLTLQWPNRNLGHSWNAVCDSNNIHISFMGAESEPGEFHLGTRLRKSKVYRATFGKQHLITQKDNLIPAELRNRYMKDVSIEYEGCNFNVDLPADFTNPEVVVKDVYLLSWGKEASSIVASGELKDRRMCFSNIGKNVLYLPISYSADTYAPIGYPFYIDDNGNLQHLSPNVSFPQPIIITDIGLSQPLLYRMQLGVFEGANRSDFFDKKVLFTIEDMPSASFQSIKITNSGPYRYVRYVSPKGGHCNVAEIEFYDFNNIKLKGEHIGTPGSWYNSPMTCDKAFDGDIYTYFDATEADFSWTGLDLGKKRSINEIRFFPRIEDNRISQDCIYALYYWDGQDWKVFEKKKPNGSSLHFQVPSNSLFYIRNGITGSESNKYFTVKDGKQIWL